MNNNPDNQIAGRLTATEARGLLQPAQTLEQVEDYIRLHADTMQFAWFKAGEISEEVEAALIASGFTVQREPAGEARVSWGDAEGSDRSYDFAEEALSCSNKFKALRPVIQEDLTWELARRVQREWEDYCEEQKLND